MTIVDERPDIDVDVVLDQGDGEQSRMHRLLWGDKSAKKVKQSRRGPTRKQTDPTIAGLGRIRAMRAVLLVALALGALGGTKALLTSSSTQIAAPTADVAAEPERDVGVGGFGELYVAAWLGAGRDNSEVLAPYYAGPIDYSDASPSGSLYAARTAAVSLTEVSTDYWSVVVAADVLIADEEGVYTSGGIRYYAMGIVKSDDGFGAAGLPAQIPAPPTLEAPDLVVAGLDQPSGDLEPIATAVDGFLDAFLADTGDLERFVAPDTALSPISPAPFVEVTVASIGARPETADPSRFLVRAQVAATDGAGNTQILQYTIVMSQRAQRWEVVELVAAPPTDTTN